MAFALLCQICGVDVCLTKISKQSGILGLLEPGDNIMEDNGFIIHDILPRSVTLNIPPFKRPK